VTAVASLVGVGVYNSYLKEVPLRRIFLWTTVLGTGLGLTQVTPNSYLFVSFPSQMAQDLA
jgi:hypothetical protein